MPIPFFPFSQRYDIYPRNAAIWPSLHLILNSNIEMNGEVREASRKCSFSHAKWCKSNKWIKLLLKYIGLDYKLTSTFDLEDTSSVVHNIPWRTRVLSSDKIFSKKKIQEYANWCRKRCCFSNANSNLLGSSLPIIFLLIIRITTLPETGILLL